MNVCLCCDQHRFEIDLTVAKGTGEMRDTHREKLGFDGLCTLREIHQQSGNSGHLSYKAEHGGGLIIYIRTKRQVCSIQLSKGQTS